MKRLFSLILTLILVLALAPAVSADVISPFEMVASGLDLKTVLLAVGVAAVSSGMFLWLTRNR